MVRERQRTRVERVTDAAAFIGVSRQRLQEMRSAPAPWWRDEFQTSEGYDVVGIGIAQAEYHLTERLTGGARTTTTTTAAGQLGHEKVIADANALEAVESARIKTLERMKRERVELQASRQLISAHIVTSLFTEALSQLRTQIGDLCYKFWRQVPDQFRHLVFSDNQSADCGGEPALLEQLVDGVVNGFEDYLEMISSELFDPSEDDDGDDWFNIDTRTE